MGHLGHGAERAWARDAAVGAGGEAQAERAAAEEIKGFGGEDGGEARVAANGI